MQINIWRDYQLVHILKRMNEAKKILGNAGKAGKAGLNTVVREGGQRRWDCEQAV